MALVAAEFWSSFGSSFPSFPATTGRDDSAKAAMGRGGGGGGGGGGFRGRVRVDGREGWSDDGAAAAESLLSELNFPPAPSAEAASR